MYVFLRKRGYVMLELQLETITYDKQSFLYSLKKGGCYDIDLTFGTSLYNIRTD